MDVQLKELIEKIKNEGVGKAEAEARALLGDAEARAQRLVADAEAKAASIVAEAQAQAQRAESSGRDALKQAARDVLLSLEKKITALFQAVVREGADAALVPALIEKMALELAKAWASQGDKGIEVVLGSADAAKLGEALRSALGKTVRGGVTIVPSDRFSRGFRVSAQGSALTVDLSAGALADLLSEALQPALAEILRESVR